MSDPRKNIPTKDTNATGWLEWHKSLKSVMDLQSANTVWSAYWSSYGSTWKDDKALREYMKKQGIDISNALDVVGDKARNIAGVIGNVFKGGMIITLVIGGVIAFALLRAVLKVSKDPIGATNAVGNLKGGGLNR